MYKAQTLDSEKYLKAEKKRWAKENRRERNRKAIENFYLFLLGLIGIGTGVLLITYSSEWMPLVSQFIRSIQMG